MVYAHGAADVKHKGSSVTPASKRAAHTKQLLPILSLSLCYTSPCLHGQKGIAKMGVPLAPLLANIFTDPEPSSEVRKLPHAIPHNFLDLHCHDRPFPKGAPPPQRRVGDERPFYFRSTKDEDMSVILCTGASRQPHLTLTRVHA